MTLKQITEDNFSSLLRSVDPTHDLLGRLRSVPFVKDRVSDIRQKVTDDCKNDELLNVLCEVPDNIQESVMNGFVSALRNSGQDHVANVFHKTSDKVLMSEEHYEVLNVKIDELAKFTDTKNGLLDRLISHRVITLADAQRIQSTADQTAMTRELVEILLRKSDCAFYEFVSALNQTNQSHVSYLLTGIGIPPMSDEHRKILNAKIYELGKFTDTENGLLVRLISDGVITDNDAEQIRLLKDQNAMAEALVKILRRKSDDTFQKFIAFLNETGQKHVAYILTGEGSSRPLKEKYRIRLLTSPRNYLVKTIDSTNSGFITALMDKCVFSSYDEQRVTSIQPDTSYTRNEIILNLIARKSQSDFFNFISALNDTGQTHVVVKLIGSDVVAKIKTVYESGIQGDHLPDVDAELMEYMRKMFQCNGDTVRRLNEHLSQNGVTVSRVTKGSIEVTFACQNVASLHNFRDLYASGKLETMLNEAFCFQFVKKGLKSLNVVISNEQFEQCAQTFAHWVSMTSQHRDALLTSEEQLLNKITVSGDLLDKLSLCRRRREAIERAATPEQQMKTLIDIISRQPDSIFEQFLSALTATNQREAVDIINDSRRSTKSEARKLCKTHPEDASEDADVKKERLTKGILRYFALFN